MEPGKLKKNILNFATLFHKKREWELNFFPYHSFTLTIIAYPAQVHLSKMLKKNISEYWIYHLLCNNNSSRSSKYLYKSMKIYSTYLHKIKKKIHG